MKPTQPPLSHLNGCRSEQLLISTIYREISCHKTALLGTGRVSEKKNNLDHRASRTSACEVEGSMGMKALSRARSMHFVSKGINCLMAAPQLRMEKTRMMVMVL